MEASNLYKFEKGDVHTHLIVFVSRAAKKVDRTDNYSRPLEMVRCDGSRIFATDGHRLNIYTPDECPLPAGIYTIEKKTKTCIYLSSSEEDSEIISSYPNIDKVIQKAENLIEFKNTDKDNMLAEVFRKMNSGCINTEFFIDAISCGGVESFLVIDEYKPISLYGDYTLSIIMPKR